jgi:two-component system NtrC family sensor kinase
VKSLKSFSRTDDGEKVATDVNTCIESAITITWNEIKYKSTLQKDLGVIPRTLSCPSQLNQVFMNLLINAVQAIEKDGRITVRTWHEDPWVCASVSDTGCGISPEILCRIFEPFFTTKEIGAGTGLGLSISYELIQRHGGDILVDSTPGKGSTFTVRLPVMVETASA